MKPIRSFVLFGSVMLLVMSASMFAGKKGTDRPWTGSLEGFAQLFLDEESVCWPGPTVVTTATGNLSHLGLVAAHFSHCPGPVSAGGAPITHGTLTLVAANGDQLWGTYEDEDAKSPFLIYFQNGTGRFENVEGWIDLYWGIQRPSDPSDFFNPFPWWATIDGEISY